jgi:predicted alpha/beta superfamily hydrolase
VLVYLPPDYERHDERRYPVLYLQDGQNVFDGATAYIAGREWHVDETAERLIRAGDIRPAIIVAIEHAETLRADEFAPTRDSRRSAGGRAPDYARMLVEELKPLIDARFRTRKESTATAVGGSSMGALASLVAGLNYPDVFGAIVTMSPSLWWDRRVLLRQVADIPRRLPWRIWLDVGTGEGREAVRNVRRLRDLLVAKGWEGGRDLRYCEMKGAAHDEAAWAARVEMVLRFLYAPAGTTTPPRKVQRRG